MKQFSSAIDMARFINNLSITSLEKEQLMLKGLQHKRVNGAYAIEIPKQHFELNGDIANDFNDMQEADYWDGDDSW